MVDLRVKGNVAYFFRCGRIFSLDISDPSRVRQLDSLRLAGAVRDMELWGNKVIAASDSQIVVIDASDPENMEVERTVGTCGRVLDIDVVESSAFFVTRAGIGRVNLQDDSEEPEQFSFLLPTFGGGWEIIDAPMESCLGFLFRALGGHRGFGGPVPGRFLEVEDGRAFLAAGRNLVVVDLDPDGYSVTGTMRFGSRITGLKVEDDFAYLNLRRHILPVVGLSDPAEPSIVGYHDLEQWVEGIQTGYTGFYRKRGPWIEIAVIQ